MYQWNIRRKRSPVTGGALVQAGAKSDDAVGLVDQSASGGVREGPDHSEVIGVSVEHVLTLERRRHYRPDLVGQYFDGLARR